MRASTWVAIGIYRGLEEGGGGREPGLGRGTFSINRGRMIAYLVPIVPSLSNRVIEKTRERERESTVSPLRESLGEEKVLRGAHPMHYPWAFLWKKPEDAIFTQRERGESSKWVATYQGAL